MLVLRQRGVRLDSFRAGRTSARCLRCRPTRHTPAGRRGIIHAASLEGQQVSAAAAGRETDGSTETDVTGRQSLSISLPSEDEVNGSVVDGGASGGSGVNGSGGGGDGSSSGSNSNNDGTALSAQGLHNMESLAAMGLSVKEDDAWLQWQQLFERADAAAEQQSSLKVDLQVAVKGESYSQAAAVQAQLSQLAAGDTVSHLQSCLSAALTGERYGEAAALRDGGLAWLQGWWLGRGDDDPQGHLLHVRAEYGRWTGRVFKPDDIAAARGWKESTLLRLERRHSGFEEALGLPPRPAGGDAVLEVFLRADKGGKFSHQAVSFVSSAKATAFSVPAAVTSPADWLASSERSALSEGLAASRQRTTAPLLPPVMPAQPRALVPLGEDGMVRLTVSLGPDGSACISAAPDQGVAAAETVAVTAVSQFNMQELDEANATARELRGSPATPPPSPSASVASSKSPAGPAKSDYDEVLEAVAGALAAGWDQAEQLVEPNSSDDSFGSSSSSSNGNGQGPRSLDLCASSRIMLDGGSSSGASTSGRSIMFRFNGEDGGRSSSSSEDGGKAVGDDGMVRAPSELEVVGRDQFVLRVPDDEAARQRRLLRRRATLVADGRPSRALPGRDGGGRDEVVTGRLVQVEIPVGRLVRSDLKKGAPPRDLWDEVADRVVGLQESQMGRSAISRKRLADAIRSIAQKLVAGETHTDAITLGATANKANDGVVALAQLEAVRRHPAGVGTVEIGYSRVPDVASSPTRTDVFSGLYLGAFGPHGPELLTLCRGTIDGEEAVLAHKLTGDENVPAGALSFQAKIGRKYKLDPRDLYPEDLGIVGRYKGEGRIASRGHRNAKSVEGELLVFSGGTQLTGSAQLGFVWAVPGERRFLILLNRVDLRDFERTPVGPRKPCVSLLE